MKKTANRTSGFTLIELLTVIAIIGILAGIIIPTVGGVQERARRTTDLSNMKQVIQAAIIYANENNARFPGAKIKLDPTATGDGETATVFLWAAAIAKYADLNDPYFYISKSDEVQPTSTLTSILSQDKKSPDSDFENTPSISLQLLAGLTQSASSVTPIIFTRGLDATTGTWDSSKTTSVYGADGGYIGYVGGNVAWYKRLDDSGGVLTKKADGSKTKNIKDTVSDKVMFLGRSNSGEAKITGNGTAP